MPDEPAKIKIDDWIRPESMVTATGAGPLLSGIAYALSVQLGFPSGWSLVVISLIFATLVPVVHRKEGKMVRGAFFLATALVLFFQGASFSTVMSHTSADLSDNAMHLGESLCSVFLHPASAKDRSPTFTTDTLDEDAPVPLGWVCETIPEGYVLTPPGTGAPIVVPWLAANALLDHIAHNKAREVDTKQSPWRIRFKH